MEEYAKKAEQDERSGQQLFDEMFGGWLKGGTPKASL
jgi:hypothetical protein